jgi:hypothetical protein
MPSMKPRRWVFRFLKITFPYSPLPSIYFWACAGAYIHFPSTHIIIISRVKIFRCWIISQVNLESSNVYIFFMSCSSILYLLFKRKQQSWISGLVFQYNFASVDKHFRSVLCKHNAMHLEEKRKKEGEISDHEWSWRL